MKISIIIPLYNKALYIANAINGVIAQTYTDWELIIVDDGSTDDSVDVVEKYLKSYPQFVDKIQFIQQKNSGVSTTRNNGVKAAKGEYVCFLDADDWWVPTFLEEMNGLITAYPDAGIYGTSYYIVKNGKNKIAPIALDEGFEQGYMDYIRVYSRFLCMPLWTGAVCLTRKVFEEFDGFKPQLKLGEDFDLWIRIALRYKVAFLNKPLAYYNQDVQLSNRAVGHLHQPENHEVFYYSDYEKEFPENLDLKQLLDNKRVYNLWRYYLSRSYHSFAVKELQKVDWDKQPKTLYNQYYKIPIALLRIRELFMNYGSRCKQFIMKMS